MAASKRKVLIVDDDPLARGAILDVLEALQVECVSADSGTEALQKFTDEDIGLVITDLRMPGMSGLDLLMILKDKAPDLPVVLVSGFNINKIELASATAHADQILAKPFRMSDVVDILQRFL